MQSCLVLDVQMLCQVTSHPNVVNPQKVDLCTFYSTVESHSFIDASLDWVVQSSGEDIDLLCGGGQSSSGARAGDPEPAAAGGRVGLLAGRPRPRHLLVADVPLQHNHHYFIFFTAKLSWTPGK